jgi:hypothetical protein
MLSEVTTMGPIPGAQTVRPLTTLEREIRDYASSENREFVVTMAAEGRLWLIERFGRTNVAPAVRGLVDKRVAEPVGLPKPTGNEQGEVRQLFRLL